MSENRLIELITSKLSGSISNEDLDELNKLLEGSKENHQFYEQASRTWNRAGEYRADVNANVEQAWKSFEAKRGGKAKVAQFNPRILLRLASVLVLGLGLVFYLFNKDSNEIHLATGASEKMDAVLPDGTHIWLNELSALSYPEAFEEGSRLVTMSGAVYFNVARDEQRPFVISGKQTTVKVLGTSFEVEDYPDRGYVKVEVTSGKVEFSSNESEATSILEKGMVGVYQSAQHTIESDVSSSKNFNSWVTEKLEFEDAPLSQVAEELADYFHKEFKLGTAQLSSCKFTGTFIDPKLEDVLEVLKVSLNMTVTQEGERYTFHGKGCNN